MYFEDFYQGYSFETKKKTITKKDIISFAEKWDYQSFHLDENLARQSHYGGLIASGWQTLMIAFTLILDTQKTVIKEVMDNAEDLTAIVIQNLTDLKYDKVEAKKAINTASKNILVEK